MQGTTPHTASTRNLEGFLAVVAATACFIISACLWQVVSSQQPMWPLPALYLLEILVVSVLAMLDILSDKSKQFLLRGMLIWAAVGVLLAFVAMAAWSIGFLLAPVASILAIVAILSDRRQRQNIPVHLGVGLAAALAQVALMLAVIRLLHSDAIF